MENNLSGKGADDVIAPRTVPLLKVVRQNKDPVTSTFVQRWSKAQRSDGAKVLILLRKMLYARRLCSIYDPRVGAEVRTLWLHLIHSDAVEELSFAELGRQLKCVIAPRPIVSCGSIQRSTRVGTISLQEKQSTFGSGFAKSRVPGDHFFRVS